MIIVLDVQINFLLFLKKIREKDLLTMKKDSNRPDRC